MSDFHGRIMNLQPDYAKPDAHAVVYKRGFRDARHVAAEIGLEADALLVRLNEAQSDAGAWEATAQHHYEEARVAEARLAETLRSSIRGDIEAAYNGLDYLTSIHVATAADPNGGRQLAIDAAEIKGRLLQHMKRIDAVVTTVTVNASEVAK